MASQAELERAGDESYQDEHMSELFTKGMSFSGFERDALYWNVGEGKYLDISGASGIDSLSDGRGSAFADLDNDGDLDVLVTPLQGNARLLFRNNVGQDSAYVRVDLEGTRSARDAFGAVARLRGEGDTKTKIKAGGHGFVSSGDPRLVFGLGTDVRAEARYELTITWPSGLVETIPDVRPNESLYVVEGRGRAERVTETRLSLPDEESAFRRLVRTLAIDTSGPMPELNLVEIPSGAPLSLTSVRKPGRKTLLNVWATWCIPCAQEMPELNNAYKSLSEAGVDLVGVSLDFGRLDAAHAYLEERSIAYPNYLLREEELGKIFASAQASVPLSLVLDAEGRLIDAFSGWSAETRRSIEALTDAR